MSHSKRKHAVLSPSATERWWNCPGSVKACASIPNPPNMYTAEGTVAHELAERLLLQSEANLEEFIGREVEKDGFNIEITEEMIDSIYTYRDYIFKVWEENGRPEMIIERKVEIPNVNFGSPDLAMVVPFDSVHIFDLKFGQGKKVHAWENKQLMTYALAYMIKEDCTKFTIHICQPRVEDGFTTFSGTSDDIHAFEDELKMKALAALSPTAPMIPGDWCKSTFCPNRVGCPAIEKMVRSTIVSDFKDTRPVVESLTKQHILNVLRYEDTIKDWMSKVREHAKELMLQGEEIPGYKIVASQGNAKWIDEKVIEAEFGDEFGDKLFTEPKLISPAQFEKLAGKKRLGKDFRDEYTMRPDNGYRIVEEDAKGETVKINKPQEDFKDE